MTLSSPPEPIGYMAELGVERTLWTPGGFPIGTHADRRPPQQGRRGPRRHSHDAARFGARQCPRGVLEGGRMVCDGATLHKFPCGRPTRRTLGGGRARRATWKERGAPGRRSQGGRAWRVLVASSRRTATGMVSINQAMFWYRFGRDITRTFLPVVPPSLSQCHQGVGASCKTLNLGVDDGDEHEEITAEDR